MKTCDRLSGVYISPFVRQIRGCLFVLALAALTACGGGSSGGNDTDLPQDPPTTTDNTDGDSGNNGDGGDTDGDSNGDADTPTEPDEDVGSNAPAPDNNGGASVLLIGNIGFDATDQDAFASFFSVQSTEQLV